MFNLIGADGRQYGPISADQVRQWIREGRANGQTQVQPEGGTWCPLGSLAEFVSDFSMPLPSATIQSHNHPLALIGFSLSLVSITVGFCCCSGLPFSVTGLTCSAIALGQIRKQPERYSGRSFALAGAIISAISLIAGLLFLIFTFAVQSESVQRELQKL